MVFHTIKQPSGGGKALNIIVLLLGAAILQVFPLHYSSRAPSSSRRLIGAANFNHVYTAPRAEKVYSQIVLFLPRPRNMGCDYG